jgi:hypothetical protein
MPLSIETIIALSIALGTLIYSIRGSSASSIKAVTEATKTNLEFYQQRVEAAESENEQWQTWAKQVIPVLQSNNLPFPDPPFTVQS